MSESAEVRAPARAGSWLGAVAATGVAAAAWAGYWWLAVPRHDFCAAVLPAPAGCRIADRVSTATLWTAVVGVLWLATVALVVARPRGRWWPFGVGMAVLVIVALAGYRAVLYRI
ncbi:hypothetical protein ACQPYA_20335 [Micromonospora sp. CA-263727]|uniref:hypothetical protein n=1 Tax=Micromonospora sp. CA-263727 TaxID=3239967 RepID=UPI003D8BDBA2